MELERTSVPEQVIGSLKSCLVEGDPEQRQRERKIRRRALVASIGLQSIVVAALILFPLLGKSERISLADRWTILPPYRPAGPMKHDPGITKPINNGKKVCIVCFNPSTPLKPPITGETVNTTLNNTDGDAIPGLPTGPGVPGSLDLSPSSKLPEPPKERSVESKKRLTVTSLELAALTHRVEPIYPPLAKQTGREGRVELHAIISTDGTIQSLEVVSGDPLFYQSALAAVREWQYRPTFLNGKAVEIDTHITVVYKLNR
jgi:protein TonB